MKTKKAPNNCPSCGAEDLFSGWFDADDLAFPVNVGDRTPEGVRWATFCNNCGAEVKLKKVRAHA